MWRSDQCLTASRMLRLDHNVEEEGYLDAALLFTCRLPGIAIGPSALFATCTDSRRKPPDDSKQCSNKPTARVHYISLQKTWGVSLFACVCSHRIGIE
jgi:hypothetical protein